MQLKEYQIDALFESLDPPERYAAQRSGPHGVRAGAGATANLVKLGLAEFRGPATWLANLTPLGLQVSELANS